MPIQIKELVIKVTVDDKGAAEGSSNAATSSAAQENIVEACVEKVLEILNRQKER